MLKYRYIGMGGGNSLELSKSFLFTNHTIGGSPNLHSEAWVAAIVLSMASKLSTIVAQYSNPSSAVSQIVQKGSWV